MKTKSFFKSTIILLLVILNGVQIGNSQKHSSNEAFCPQLQEEIISQIKIVDDLSPDSNKILIAGEVRNPQLIEERSTLIDAIARSGGIKATANWTVYLLKQKGEISEKYKMEILDLKRIKKGYFKGQNVDIQLEKGDIVFLPRRCSKKSEDYKNPLFAG